MKIYKVEETINASPIVIWTILTDAQKYPEWNPTVERVEGNIDLGEQIKVITKANPNQAFPVKVSEFVPDQRMKWVGGMPLGLFKGERTFTLKSTANDSTQFTMEEIFSGLLFPLIGKSIPDLSDSFKQFAAGLKTYAESQR